MGVKLRMGLWFAVLILSGAASHMAIAAEDILRPRPLGGQWVYDEAGLMSEAARERVNQFLFLFRKEKGIEFYAVILPGTGTSGVNQTATDIVERWRVGKGAQGRGLLFLLSVEEKAVRLEVTYGLEAVYTDAFVSYVEHEQMIPFFEQNRIADGFEATLELIVARAKEHIAKGSYQPGQSSGEQELDYLSGGAGAKTQVALGRQSQPVKVAFAGRGQFAAQDTPRATFELYLERARQRVTDPDLGIFTSASRDFFRQWTVTNAQLDNEYRTYNGHAFEVLTEGSRAVIRFSVDDRTRSPFFLEQGPEGWQLDFVTMTRAIRFNNNNQWHFSDQNHPYMFAFRDSSFDGNGYPSNQRDQAPHPRAFLGASWYWYGYKGQGVLVYEILPGHAAEKYGLQVGDFILSFNGRRITQPRDLNQYMAASQPGERVALAIVRGGLPDTVTLRLDDGSSRRVSPATGLSQPQAMTLNIVLGERE